MRIVAFIRDAGSVNKILLHIGHATHPRAAASAGAPSTFGLSMPCIVSSIVESL